MRKTAITLGVALLVGSQAFLAPQQAYASPYAVATATTQLNANLLVPAAIRGGTELLFEDFSDAAFPPAGWTHHLVSGTASTQWNRTTAQSYSAPAAAWRNWGNGAQEDWLVSPPITLGGADNVLSFIDAGQWMDDYTYSGVMVSDGSCDPADGDFVELAEIDDTPGPSSTVTWRAAPLTLDLDATDDAVHGRQEGRFFHGYYDSYCFLPLYVFCGDELLTAYLRPANVDGAKHAAAIVKLLVQRLRQAWPQVKITLRADSGFCRRRLLSWCERNDVQYVIGLAKNSRLATLAAAWIGDIEAAFERSGEKRRGFAEFRYAARTWSKDRRVIVRAEHGPQGSNPRYVVSNRTDEPAALYDGLYCQRGEMENRIKEQQLGLFADRTSCSAWWPNQFRLLLASLAYTLMQGIRRIGLQDTELARAQCTTIRLKLFKIGAVIICSVRRIRLLMASPCPYRELFMLVAQRLQPRPSG